MVQKHIDDPRLQIGMTQYKDLSLGMVAKTPNGQFVGTVTYVSDNKSGAGEQIYAIL